MYTTPYIVLTKIENRRFLYKTIGIRIVYFYYHDIIILQKFYFFLQKIFALSNFAA